jgi:ribonucleoside-diphosphate reductase alpha chain
VNLPENATVEDIAQAYIEAWKQGIKAVAVYRDGCKKSQPLSAAGSATATSKPGVAQPPSAVALEQDPEAPPRAIRHRLAEERLSVTHKFNVGGHDGYITVGLYKNGEPGEVFITMAKEGSTVSGLMDCFATSVSLSLQHGVPLKLLCEKFAHTRFEPSGWSTNPDIGHAKSVMDYIFRWLQLRFLTGQQQFLFEGFKPRTALANPEGNGAPHVAQKPALSGVEGPSAVEPPIHASDALRNLVDMGDAPSCHVCGAIMTRNGSCYRCGSCGATSGCS